MIFASPSGKLRLLAATLVFLFAALIFASAAHADEVVPLTERMAQFADKDGCWGCQMFTEMAVVTHQLGTSVSGRFNASLSNLFGVLMGVWILWQLMKMGFNVSGSVDSNGIVQSIASKLFVYVFVVALLSMNTYDEVSKIFIYPFFDAASGFATAIMALGGVGDGGCSVSGGGSPAIQGFVTSGNQMMCSMHLATGQGLALGRYLIDVGANWSLFSTFDVGSVLAGLFLMISFFVLSVLLPFRLFDSLIRLAVVAIIVPLLVVAASFQVSRGAAKQGISSVVVASLNFVFVAAAMAISLSIMNNVISKTIGASAGIETAGQGFGPLTAGQFMLLCGTAFGMSAFVRMAGSMAAEFAGFQGQQGDVGSAAAAVPQKLMAGGVALAGAGIGGGVYKGVQMLRGAGKAVKSVGTAPVPPGGAI